LPDLVGEYALPTHAISEPWIIQLAAANLSNPVQDFLCFSGFVKMQPILEDGGDGKRKAQDFHSGEARAGFSRGFQDLCDLVIVQAWDDRGHQDTDWDSGI
jgi:hypothetical protein